MLMDRKPLRWCGIDMRARGRRRVAVAGTYVAAFLTSAWIERWQGHGWWTPVKALFALMLAIEFLSVFREGLLVRSFEDRPRPRVEQPFGRTMLRWAQALVRSRLVSRRFQSLTPEAQEAALQRVEDYFFSIQPQDVPDERELEEQNLASRRTLNFLAVILVYVAFNTAMNGMRPRVIDEVSLLVSFLVIARTGPKAVMLWRAPDPREVSGEMEIVREREE